MMMVVGATSTHLYLSTPILELSNANSLNSEPFSQSLRFNVKHKLQF